MEYPHSPQRLALLIHDLQSGGAQRVMSILANAWAVEGRDVTLCTLDGPESCNFFPLHPGVRHRPMGLAGPSRGPVQKIRNNAHRLLALRKLLRETKPDLFLSFIDKTNVLAVIASRGLGFPVVVSERVDPRAWDIGTVWSLLRKLTYPRADRIVIQVEAIREFFPPREHSRIDVIPNPVPVPPGAPREGDLRPRILAAGRLDHQKGFDLLIEAFEKLAEALPDWRLDILGEGPLRKDLQALISRKGLQDRICLLGNVSEIGAYLRSCDIFALSSRFEGFPNVLCEAMACGCAVVSFDCPTGPAELVAHGVNGLLVPQGDTKGLAQALARLAVDPEERLRLGRQALQVAETLSLPAILDHWERCFQKAIRR